jgi:tetratricopeptide (TPR) repeat protein
LKLNLYFFLFVILNGIYFAYGQNLNALKKEADGFFQKQNYSEAKERYLKLLAADQKNVEFNYKYGVCLFETENKQKSTKYFEFILNKPNAPVKAHLYRGKIFQHEYDFDNAIREFELCKKDIQLEKVAREEIDRCVSAKEQIKLKSSLTVKNLLKKVITRNFISFLNLIPFII